MKTTILIFSTIFILIASTGLAANWYVDRDAMGLDNGTSWSNAWESFDSINWGSISPGDTLHISGGTSSKTYNETLVLGASGEPGHPITIRVGQTAGHNGMVIIDGEYTRQRCIDGGDHDYITVDGEYNGSRRIRATRATNPAIDFRDNSGNYGIVIRFVQVYDTGSIDRDGHGIRIYWGVDSEIAYCHIDYIWDDGIQVRSQYNATGWGHNCEIHHNTISNICDDAITFSEGNDVHDNIIGPWREIIGHSNDPHPDGVQYYGGWNRFWNNIFYSTLDGGTNALIFADMDGNHEAGHHRMYNNVFFTAGGAYSGHRWVGITLKTESNATYIDDVVIANNTFVDMGGTAVRLNAVDASDVYTNVVIKNNLIYNCRTGSSYGTVFSMGDASYSTEDIVISSNLIHEGPAGTANIEYKGTRYESVSMFDLATGFSNIYCSPVFISYIEGNGLGNDLHLDSAASCAIDQGENLSTLFTIDKDGVFRPQGDGWDIGAYEYDEGYVPAIPSAPTNLRISE